MKCICENMIEVGADMHNPIYKSANYKNLALYESYGFWYLQFLNDNKNNIEIFYCPFCGRKLNKWYCAKERRIENFKRGII